MIILNDNVLFGFFKGLSGVSQAKVVTAAQASLVPAQFILHQPATGNVKVGGSDTSVTPTVTQGKAREYLDWMHYN